ncbi:GNAT family N-acetyltransferase [Chitinimonas koreensis]|uniref:GNAT family N-acetyltransferase n=1 Tax=Chitinimonas koreensis TaxID=356302 RepID=UPI000688663E|nr:GNAT family N-acetyltransferase [Chitinimonas koreensis]QNM94723.1 GNAT family N-acetyltransferase [Chitinimonas koreensis]
MQTDRSAKPIFLLHPWRPGDAVEALTELLHDAFAPLQDLGLDCASGRQTVAATTARLRRGQGFAATLDGELIGSLTVYRPQHDSECRTYRRPGTASVHQFAVRPDWQGHGVGRSLLSVAEGWAAAQGYDQLALDTPAPAGHLLDYYRRLGFTLQEELRFSGRAYPSAVLGKPLSGRDCEQGRRCGTAGMEAVAGQFTLALATRR